MRAYVAMKAEALKAGATIEQMESAYYKLPVVPKPLIQGPRGGVYYVNARGRKVYLKVEQQRQLAAGDLPGCIGQECARPNRKPYRRMNSER